MRQYPAPPVFHHLDGTWATPIFCQPLTLGVDVASMSNYGSGHFDCMMGMIASCDDIGAQIRKTTFAIGDIVEEAPGT